jgi:hypothetical protein
MKIVAEYIVICTIVVKYYVHIYAIQCNIANFLLLPGQ